MATETPKPMAIERIGLELAPCRKSSRAHPFSLKASGTPNKRMANQYPRFGSSHGSARPTYSALTPPKATNTAPPTTQPCRLRKSSLPAPLHHGIDYRSKSKKDQGHDLTGGE